MKDRRLSFKKLFGIVALLLVIILLLFINFENLINSSVNKLPEQLAKLASQHQQQQLTESIQAEEDSFEIAETESSTGGTVSYSFVGKKSLSELLGRDDGEDPINKQTDEKDGQEYAGDNEITDGDIPDLTIRLNGLDLEAVAHQLGFQLVASTPDRILGKIINGKLNAMSERDRSGYAVRGREATGLPNYSKMVRVLSNHLDISRSKIRLFYLVPNEIEQQFIQFQRREMAKAGIRPDEIELMIAQYTPELDLELVSFIQK